MLSTGCAYALWVGDDYIYITAMVEYLPYSADQANFCVLLASSKQKHPVEHNHSSDEDVGRLVVLVLVVTLLQGPSNDIACCPENY